jgi:hypothetical protein
MAGQEWEVVFDDEFLAEFEAFEEMIQDKILARAGPASPIRAAIAATLFGHARRIGIFKYERIAGARRKTGLAYRFRLRSEAPSDIALCRQQGKRKPAGVLWSAYCRRGQEVREIQMMPEA